MSHENHEQLPPPEPTLEAQRDLLGEIHARHSQMLEDSGMLAEVRDKYHAWRARLQTDQSPLMYVPPEGVDTTLDYHAALGAQELEEALNPLEYTASHRIEPDLSEQYSVSYQKRYDIPVGYAQTDQDGTMTLVPYEGFTDEDVKLVKQMSDELEQARTEGQLPDLTSDLQWIYNPDKEAEPAAEPSNDDDPWADIDPAPIDDEEEPAAGAEQLDDEDGEDAEQEASPEILRQRPGALGAVVVEASLFRDEEDEPTTETPQEAGLQAARAFVRGRAKPPKRSLFHRAFVATAHPWKGTKNRVLKPTGRAIKAGSRLAAKPVAATGKAAGKGAWTGAKLAGRGTEKALKGAVSTIDLIGDKTGAAIDRVRENWELHGTPWERAGNYLADLAMNELVVIDYEDLAYAPRHKKHTPQHAIQKPQHLRGAMRPRFTRARSVGGTHFKPE